MDFKDNIVTNTLYPIVQAIPESLNTDTVSVVILRLSDGWYWNFTTLAMQASSASGTMTFVADILWKQSFTPPTNDVYIATIYDETLDVKYTQYLTAAGSFSSIPSTFSQSKVRVWNMAISKVAGKPVSTDSEDSAAQRVCSIFWDDILAEILAEHQWTFAQKRFVLPLVSTTPVFTDDGVQYVYGKPSDLIKINFISNPAATWKVEGDTILSNSPNLKIIYTQRIDDVSKFFPLFTSALATRLAAEIAPKLSESVKTKSELMQEYEQVRLPRAIAGDSQQGSPVQPIQDEWELARFSAGGGFVISPGAQTWIPV